MIELFGTALVVTAMVGAPIAITLCALLLGYWAGKRAEASCRQYWHPEMHQAETRKFASLPTTEHATRWKPLVHDASPTVSNN